MPKSGAVFPSPLDSTPLFSPTQGFAENTLLNVTLLFSSTCSLFHLGWKGDSEADNYIADVGFLEENRGNYRDYPAVIKTPHSLPTGPIILQTATIKNDLSSLANFTMLLHSLGSYPALKKSTTVKASPLSKWRGWDLMTTI